MSTHSPDSESTQAPAPASAESNQAKAGLLDRVLGLRSFWFGAVGFALAIPALLLTIGTFRSEPLPVYAQLPSFSFTDQDERPFSLEGAQGRVLVANFIFTTCPVICPALSRKMADVQERTRKLESLHLVSFTVDPENDTPAVLKEFGAKFGQDTSRWSMVTGPLEEVERTVIEGFKVGIDRKTIPDAEPGTMDVDIVHGEHFVLVDQQGRIRGYYRADEEGLNRLVREARRLVAEGPNA